MTPNDAESGSHLRRIQSIQVEPVMIPMPVPHRTASGVVEASPLVLTRITTDDGVTGVSLIFTYMAAALKPTADLVAGLEGLIVGRSAAPQLIFDYLHSRFRLLGAQGLTGMAIAAIDMALWDAAARRHGIPLARLLGGDPQPIQAYGAVGYDGAVESARVAEDWARRGFRGVKAKIGYPSVAEDVEVVRAIRAAVGPDVAVMVDYNQSLLPSEAVERCLRLDEEGLEWIEEPVASHDFRGHAQVARAVRTPIQSGENWWGPGDLRHALEAGASDQVMLDAMKIGGVTGWMRAASIASGYRISSHLWPELSAQLLSVTPGAHWLEYADWWAPAIRESLRVEDGMAWPSSQPGSGVNLAAG